MTNSKETYPKISVPRWAHLGLLACLFLAGFSYELWEVNANRGITLNLVILFVLLACILSTTVYLFSNRSIRILKSRLLVWFLVWAGVLGLSLAVYWRNWYQSLFVAETNVMFWLIVALATYLISNAYNSFAQARQLLVVTLWGYISGSVLALLVLIANLAGILSMPNLTTQKDTILINVILVCLLGLVVLPSRIVNKSSKKFRVITIAAFLVSMGVLGFLANFQIAIMAMGVLLVANLLHTKRKALMLQLAGVIGLFLMVFGLRLLPEIFVNLSDLQPHNLDFISSVQVSVNAILNTNPAYGQGAREFTETYRHFQVPNLDTEFTPDQNSAASTLLQTLADFGVIGLVFTLVFLGILYKAAKELSPKYNSAPEVIGIVQAVIAIFIVSSVLLRYTAQFGIVLIPALVIMSNMLSNAYWRFEGARTQILRTAFSLSLIWTLVYFGMTGLVFGANWVYGYAYQGLNSPTANQQATLDKIELANQIDPYNVRYQLDLINVYTQIFLESLPKDVTLKDYQSYKPGVEKLVALSDRTIMTDQRNWETWGTKVVMLTSIGRVFPDVLNQDSQAADALSNLLILRAADGKVLLGLADYLKSYSTELRYQITKIAYQNNINVAEAGVKYARVLISRNANADARTVLARVVNSASNDQMYIDQAKSLLAELK